MELTDEQIWDIVKATFTRARAGKWYDVSRDDQLAWFDDTRDTLDAISLDLGYTITQPEDTNG